MEDKTEKSVTISACLTPKELMKFSYFDMFSTSRFFLYLTMVLIGGLVLIALNRSIDSIIVLIISIILGGFYLYNLFYAGVKANAERVAPKPNGLTCKISFYGTFYIEEKGNIRINIPYNSVLKSYEKKTAFYIYFDPNRGKLTRISEDGFVDNLKRTSGLATIIPKEGLSEREISFVRELILENK